MKRPNIKIFQARTEVRGRVQHIILGDFNMTPEEIAESGMLEANGLAIITAGKRMTCKRSHGICRIDYSLVDTDIVALLSEVQLLVAVPWSPHFGLAFDSNCRLATTKTKRLVRPRAIPYERGEKGILK